LTEMTEDKKTVTPLPASWDLNTPLQSRFVRVFRTFPLGNHRPEDCLATGFSDLQLIFCETHALMRTTESLTQAILPQMFQEKLADDLNRKLEEVGVR